MNRFSLVCIALFYFSTVWSQQDTAFRLKKFIGSIEVHAGVSFFQKDTVHIPNYGYDRADAGFPDDKRYFYSRNRTPGSNYGGAIYGNVRLYKGLRLKFGLGYESFQSKTAVIDTFYIQSYDYSSNNWSSGISFVALPVKKLVRTVRVNYERHFVSLPLKLHYYFPIRKKISLNAGLGLILGFAPYQKIEARSTDGSYNYSTHTTPSLDGLIEFSVGSNYYISKKLSLSFDPFLRIGGFTLYTAGGRIGFSF
ncbi:MAG: hypothetical protein K0S33_732 [Bacteroidetes bacterium]|jgi:hypothetical protein|nr:hypothetical protein [Bacteroidota bacterium]